MRGHIVLAGTTNTAWNSELGESVFPSDARSQMAVIVETEEIAIAIHSER